MPAVAAHRIGAGVVGGAASEDIHADPPLLQVAAPPIQRFNDDIAQEGCAALAPPEERTRQDPGQLLSDCLGLVFSRSPIPI